MKCWHTKQRLHKNQKPRGGRVSLVERVGIEPAQTDGWSRRRRFLANSSSCKALAISFLLVGQWRRLAGLIDTRSEGSDLTRTSRVVCLFGTDNNGVLQRLPSQPGGSAASATGSPIFGINAQSNNQLGSALVFAADPKDGFARLCRHEL